MSTPSYINVPISTTRLAAEIYGGAVSDPLRPAGGPAQAAPTPAPVTIVPIGTPSATTAPNSARSAEDEALRRFVGTGACRPEVAQVWRRPLPGVPEALEGYPAGRKALDAKRAVEDYRARKAANQQQRLRASRADAILDAATYLRQQLPAVSEAESLRLVVGVITRWSKTQSESSKEMTRG